MTHEQRTSSHGRGQVGQDSGIGVTSSAQLVDGSSSWISRHLRSHEPNSTFDTEVSPSLSWKERLRHFTWSFFTLTMATGGMANVVSAVPFQSRSLYAIGCMFTILNVILFVLNCLGISLRFYYWPSTFRASLTHPTESLFVPSFMISIATILVNIVEYGLHTGNARAWLSATMVVCFWVYITLAIVFSAGIYLIIWSTQRLTISRMTPVWILPAYPLLLVGPFAGVLSDPSSGISRYHTAQFIVGGVVLQGMGFLLALTMHATYMYRLMTQKLPQEPSRPTMFISVGPSAFTVAGLINMAHNFPNVVPKTFMGNNGQLVGQVSQIMAYWAGIWIWGLSLFFFLLACGAHWSCITKSRMHFALTWNSFVFPNTALATATFAVAKALDSQVLRIIGCVMACALVVVWAVVFGMLLRGIVIRQILWPQQQEDRDEDVWKSEVRARRQNELGRVSVEDAQDLEADGP